MEAQKGHEKKSTDHFLNIISSQGGQDISARDCDHNPTSLGVGQDTTKCQITGLSSHAFSRIWLTITNLPCFVRSNWCEKERNQQEDTKIWLVLCVGQNASACQIILHVGACEFDANKSNNVETSIASSWKQCSQYNTSFQERMSW